MGALAPMIIMIVVVIIVINKILAKLIDKNPQLKKPRTVLWIILGVVFFFMMYPFIVSPSSGSAITINAAVIAAITVVLGIVFLRRGVKNLSTKSIAFSSFLFGTGSMSSIWAILFFLEYFVW